MISERLLRIGVMSSNDYLLPLLHEAEQVSDILPSYLFLTFSAASCSIAF